MRLNAVNGRLYAAAIAYVSDLYVGIRRRFEQPVDPLAVRWRSEPTFRLLTA